MNATTRRLRCLPLICSLLVTGRSATPSAAGEDITPPDSDAPKLACQDVLSPQQWEQVDRCVDRALAWMVTQQRRDGSFRTLRIGQPGVTSLCLLAFLSRGHLPGEGPYGEHIDAGIDFVLSSQKPDGLIAYATPQRAMQPHNAAHTAIYNHTIGGLLLGEVYGMTDKTRAARIRPAIEKALGFTRAQQLAPKRQEVDRGGWRYIRRWNPSDSDLSVTAWQLMFLRSAKNAGFEVPSEFIDQAMQYVQRCFESRRKTFLYGLIGRDRRTSRAMAGAGILSLSLGGLHNTPMARAAGDWVLQHPFDRYNMPSIHARAGLESDSPDRYHYGAYYCSQAMLQLGGHYWAEFYPSLVRTLVAHQTPEGCWDVEAGEDYRYGNVYTTALTVLAMTTPYQLLPIYQR